MIIRPRRSVLYMPGSNARAIEKAKTLPADGIILDLEDSVAPEAKETARAQVTDAVKAGGFGAREVFIRVNGIDTQWFSDDMEAAIHAAPDAIQVSGVRLRCPDIEVDQGKKRVQARAVVRRRVFALGSVPA